MASCMTTIYRSRLVRELMSPHFRVTTDGSVLLKGILNGNWDLWQNLKQTN